MSAPHSDPSCRRVLVIHNPVAGQRHADRFARVVAALCAEGCTVTVRHTRRRGDAEALARAATAEAHDALAAAGGDGTVNEVINGLSDFRLPLAIIPLGTANVLAHEIGLSGQPRAVARTIARSAPVAVKVGLANGRRFAQMAGIGFDARVVAGVDPAVKRLLGRMALGKLAYVLETLVQLIKYPFPRYRLVLDGQPIEAASAVVANGRFYGGRFVCAPQARLDADSFQVCVFRRSGRWDTLRYAWGLLSGRLRHFRDVAVVAAREITIEGPDGDPVQGDGDVLGVLPLRVTALPTRLRLLMP